MSDTIIHGNDNSHNFEGNTFNAPVIIYMKEELDGGNLESVLNLLENSIPDDSPFYEQFLSFKRSQLENKKTRIELPIADPEVSTIDKERDLLMERMSEWLEKLEGESIKHKTDSETKEEKLGSVCYRIPPTMLVDERNDCTVWIAFEKDTLLKEIEIELDDQEKAMRVSDAMGVELIDDSGDAFKIKIYPNNKDGNVQPIEKDLATKWTFRVTPLKEGIHQLVLCISAIILQNGKERKKTIVLEENIDIVSTETEELQKAKLFHGKEIMSGLFVVPPSDINIPYGDSSSNLGGIRESLERIHNLNYLQSMILTASIAVIGIVGYHLYTSKNAPAVEGQSNSQIAITDSTFWGHIGPTRDSSELTDYLKSFPKGLFRQEALNLLAIWPNQVAEVVTSSEENQDLEGQTNRRNKNNSNESRLSADKNHTSTTGENRSTTNPNTAVTSLSNPVTHDDAVPVANAYTRPVHPDCLRKNERKWNNCTKDQIQSLVENKIRAASKHVDLKGSVTVTFYVEKSGRISSVIPMGNDNNELTDEVIKALRKLPPFRPGRDSEGKPLKVSYTIPVRMK